MSTTVAKPKKRVITRKELAKQKVLIAWSAVFVIYGFIFCYLPLAGWLMAFENYKNKTGLLHSKWVGLDKFKFLFSDATFLRVIRNTFCMGTLNLIFTTITAIVFAILLNEFRFVKGKKFNINEGTYKFVKKTKDSSDISDAFLLITSIGQHIHA